MLQVRTFFFCRSVDLPAHHWTSVSPHSKSLTLGFVITDSIILSTPDLACVFCKDKKSCHKPAKCILNEFIKPKYIDEYLRMIVRKGNKPK